MNAADLIPALHTNGITMAEAAIIVEVVRREESGERRRVSDISEALGMPVSTCSRLAWTLCVKHGLLRQVVDPSDRRVRILEVNTESLEKMTATAA